MSKFVKTYYPAEGTNYIQDPDLVLASKILTVHKSGKSNDPGTGNRSFTYSSTEGRIYFPNNFNAGETVRVWWEAEGGPTPVCTPVTASVVMPSGIENVYYLYDVVLNGTGPFALTVNTKPAWMTVVIFGDHIQFYGTPDTEGVFPIDILITNCSGGGSLPVVQNITIADVPDPVTPGDGDFKISNNAPAFAKITGFTATLLIGSFSYTPSSGSLPLNVGQSMVGVFTPFTGFLKVTLTNVLIAVTLTLKKNGVTLQTISVGALANGVKTFNSQTFIDTDLLEIVRFDTL